MCIDRRTIQYRQGVDWFTIQVPCNSCWDCLKRKVSDIVGRCLAEQAFSDWSLYVTLTYANRAARQRDGAHEMLYAPHVQRFVRALRDGGTTLRYLAVGEYGDIKGRAHWHALFFGKGVPPAWPLRERVNVNPWPHGHIYVDSAPGERAMRYVCHYLLKDAKWNKHCLLSKRPPLGNEFFMALAARDHALGVQPDSFEYVPPGSLGRFRHFMTGATRRNYLLERARLAAVDPLELFVRPNEWVYASLEKADKWLARDDKLSLDELKVLDKRTREVLEYYHREPVKSWHEPEEREWDE